MRPFQELVVWRKAHALEVYRETSRFPAHELYGLVSQTRRAAVSIPANVAEGSGRQTAAEFGQFLNVALGSATELEYHLILARDLSYIPKDVHDSLAERLAEVKRILVAFKRHLRSPGVQAEPGRAGQGANR